jgi:hypothetical protein
MSRIQISGKTISDKIFESFLDFKVGTISAADTDSTATKPTDHICNNIGD